MVLGNWLLLRRLKKAIQKVRFLLSFHVHKWRLPSMIDSSSRRQLSFNNAPGLIDCTADVDVEDCEMGLSPSPIQRTRSDASDDIDRRAEMFIANFHRHIQMERQVSLELRYAKGVGLERTRSD
ncbi:uncharacterized protein LOC131217643 [Magnolia sinica]|uniref:uncharacterized protein LOC131217643 n=1 Tax=Magnolia sinica TaxID=86752 RepID=UPI0026590FC3|nr:uncharacterized protein LOC131217643 [Magnolia sinica]